MNKYVCARNALGRRDTIMNQTVMPAWSLESKGKDRYLLNNYTHTPSGKYYGRGSTRNYDLINSREEGWM